LIQLRILGQWKLTADDGSELRAVLTQPKRFALLTYLALATPRGFHRRDTLMAMFWPEVDEERGRNSLRQAVHHLRQALGSGAILSRGDEELAVDADRLSCDVTNFERALDADDLPTGLELYRGDLLPGLFVPDAAGFGRWLETERARLKGRAADAAWALAEREAAGGNAAGAGHWARWAAALTPDDELAVQRLMILLARIGDRAGAVRAYHAFEQRLSEEDSGSPSARTQTLLLEIEERPALVPAGPLLAIPAAMTAAAVPVPPPPAAPDVARSAVPPGAAAPSRLRRMPLVAAGAVVLAVATVAVWRRQAESAIPVDDNAVATFPFAVSGDPALAYLRDGMVDLLDARLDGAGGLRTIDPHAIQAAVAHGRFPAALPPASASFLSRQLGARLFILGEIVASGGHLQLGATLYDGARTLPLIHATVDGNAARLFPLVDALAARLLAERPAGPDTRLTRVAALTTPSLDALRAYVDGERAYRAGRYQAAVEGFERATALDTAFALAWYRLAVALDWAGGPARDAVTHALAHAAALAPRDRMLVGAFWQYLNFDASTERVYHLAVAQYPDEVEAWSFLGETQFHQIEAQGRSFTEARDAFTKVLGLDPGNPNAVLHLARIAAAEGRGEELDSLARLYVARYPDADRALEMRVLRAFSLGDRAEEERLIAELPGTGDVTLELAARDVAAYVQDLDGAERLVPLLTAPARTAFYAERGRTLDAELALAAGRWGESQRRIAILATENRDWALEMRALFAAEPLTPASPAELTAVRDDVLRWRPHLFTPGAGNNFTVQRERWEPQLRAYLLGLISVRLGDTAAAGGYARMLDRLDGTAGDSGLAGDYAHSVRAEIARQAGALRAALAQAEQIHFTFQAPVMRATLYAGAHERFLHAELLHAVGRDEEALTWYASFPEPSGFDITYLAPAYLKQGEITEHLGRRAEALGFYRRAARLWTNCEPALRPLLAEARRAVARLSRVS
jgi:DNA-binding SARP family transcriptional activator/Tfp pilus assembly protein PilF